MLSFIQTGAGYQHSMVHGHKNEQWHQQHEIGRQWVSVEQGAITADWHGTRMASTRRGSQAETVSCHRARVRIASSTGATSKYSVFTLPRAMGRGTHLCFPDAGMLHKFHVALAYLRNSAATRALWQNQRCHKLLP